MKAGTKVKKRKWFRKELPFHLMLLPAVIITVTVSYTHLDVYKRQW